jgi:hypothetical protein
MPAMPLDSSGGRTRVVVSDGDPWLRGAMADMLQAAGYDVVQVDDLRAPLPADLRADYGVVCCRPGEVGGLACGERSDGPSLKVAIGWLRMGRSQAADLAAAAVAQRHEHVVRIFAAIAPLFIDIDRDGAERLARGVHALGSTIWGASVPSP